MKKRPNQYLPSKETLDLVMKRLGSILFSPIVCPHCSGQFVVEDLNPEQPSKFSAREVLLNLLVDDAGNNEPVPIKECYRIAATEGVTSSALRKARSRCSDVVENVRFGGAACWRVPREKVEQVQWILTKGVKE